MRLLLIGGSSFTAVVEKLVAKSQHILDHRKTLPESSLDLPRYDMVLVDGAFREGDELLLILDRIRARLPEMPVIIVNCLSSKNGNGSTAKMRPATCGVVESHDGMLMAQCRLRNMALDDYEDVSHLLRLSAPSITFEYQGVPGETRVS